MPAFASAASCSSRFVCPRQRAKLSKRLNSLLPSEPRIPWAAGYVVKLEIGVGRHIYDALHDAETRRRRKARVGEIDAERGRVTHLQVARRVVGVRFGLDPVSVGERQSWYVTVGAPDGLELPFTVHHRGSHRRVAADDSPGHRKCRLENSGSVDVRAPQFVNKAVAIRVHVHSEALLGLNPVVMIEGVVGELATSPSEKLTRNSGSCLTRASIAARA